MSKRENVNTVTMAKVYTKQGYYDKASAIYRYLLDREPTRQDLIEALRDIEEKRNNAGRRRPRDLAPLFRKWIRLLIEFDKIKKLKKLIENKKLI